MRAIWNPPVFHGGRPDKQFFEGWYFKLVSADCRNRWAVIPGVFHHPDPGLRHAFVQVLDGMTSQVTYHRFPVSAFSASRTRFEIQIGGNHFGPDGLILDLDYQDQRISGEVKFGDLIPWPVKPLSPGVMGPYRFAPLMQTYHGVLSLDHSLQGGLSFNKMEVDFSGGRGYIEKDWGKTFPRAYIWMQSNHFPHQGVSITGSVATIPWLTGWFRGFLVGLLIDDKLYRFTTYLGSEIHALSIDEHHLTWRLTGGKAADPEGVYAGCELNIRAEKSAGGLLSSPELDGMTPRILESLTATMEIELRGMDPQGDYSKVIFQGTGSCGGLEIAGTVEEIADLT